ncbi:hypothetical protein FKM82_011012 [Ascaphus truei]
MLVGNGKPRCAAATKLLMPRGRRAVLVIMMFPRLEEHRKSKRGWADHITLREIQRRKGNHAAENTQKQI